MPDWTARRILKELVDGDRRRAILADFWRFADQVTRLGAQAYLAKTLNFREVTIRKLPPERKGELLAARLASAESEPYLEAALLQHHMHHAKELMGAFLDHWGVAHEDGAIVDAEETPAPDATRVRDAVDALAARFTPGEVRLYLATAGLVMGDDWRSATWPVVDEMQASDGR
jgi:hypothetical protein